MGARPIAVMDSLRFGPPTPSPAQPQALRGDASARTAPQPQNPRRYVVGGISHYGNCFGVPTVGGECIFEDCYGGNPLVNVFALFPSRRNLLRQGCGSRQISVIYVGAKTGRATASTATLHGVG